MRIGCLSLNDKEIDDLQTIKLAMKTEEKDIKMAAHNERFHASGGADSSDTEQVTSSFALVRAAMMPPPA